MKRELFERLNPIYGVISAIEELIDENKQLKEENIYLKERLEWFEKSLEENTKATGEAMHGLIEACLDGRITINKNNETIIKQK